jgi:hypothetical protein
MNALETNVAFLGVSGRMYDLVVRMFMKENVY